MINKDLKAYNLFHEGTLCFSDMTEAGIGVNVNYYQDINKQLEKRISFLERTLHSSPESDLYKSKMNKELDLNSNVEIGKLLFNFLEISSTKKTEKGGISTSADVLESMDLLFTKQLVTYRKLAKLKATYVEGILENQVDGRIHPDFNLHLVRTYRSSSSNPNLHNIPKRDEYAMNLIRGGIIPTPGWKLIESDYGAMEVRIIVCYSLDPVLLDMLKKGVDIHQEWANFLGVSRFDAKNGFVFALFYGSFYKSVWADLMARGYKDLPIGRVRDAEQEFWNKYRVTKKWQDKLMGKYRENGYVEMLHGFRRRGFLTKNELVNAPIQGTAFHCLLWSCIEINRIRKRDKWNTKLIGEIHDSMMKDTYPPEEKMVISTTKRVMTEDILNDHPWIIVPLLAEIEVANIDQPWHKKEKYDENN